MGKAEKERLNQILGSHLVTIHETLQVLDQAPPSSLEKVSWNEVIQMGEQLSKQATVVGMLWTGEAPNAEQLEENMASYFNMLQGFLLLSHGSTVSAGPTLSSSIQHSVKQVVDASFRLMKESISLYGSRNKDKMSSIPQLVGTVWEACSALKKTPATNIVAVGRAMTQVAVSVKDVLREMKELKPASSDSTVEASDDASAQAESRNKDDADDDIIEDGLGNDLSPEEMRVAHLAIGVVTDTLATIKELIRTITGLLKLESPNDNSAFVDSLDKLLKLCQGIGAQIDELGACLYPPQELSAIKVALEKVLSNLDGVHLEVESFNGSTDTFVRVCNSLRTSVKQMNSEIDCIDTADLEEKIEKVALTS